MEDQAVVIDMPDKEEKMIKTHQTKGTRSVEPNVASSSQTKEKFKAQEAGASRENGGGGGGGSGVAGAMESQQEEEQEQDDEAFKHSLALIERRLRGSQHGEGEGGWSPSSCIFLFPLNLSSFQKEFEPEIVSIGPHHRGETHLLSFEKHKWSFLEKFLSRSRARGKDLGVYLQEMMDCEKRARECYSEIVPLSSHDFVEMMLLDGCFVVELLRHLGKSEEVIDEGDPIFTKPWLIPLLIKDLLKLENQLPYFVLETLFVWSKAKEDVAKHDLRILAFKVFDLVHPLPLEAIDWFQNLEGKHLLDLFHLSHRQLINVKSIGKQDMYRPSAQSMPSVTQLKLSGIKFKPGAADTFLDINFRRGVLEIPAITMNDFTRSMLVNCVALEQRRGDRVKYFTDYVGFMSCLISQTRDVTFLCSDGIITNFSQNDQSVASLFNALGSSDLMNVRDSYLSKHIKEVEAYYSSNWATMMRNYFSSPWSFIAVFSAAFAIALTMVQTIMSVLSYKKQFG
ncbi:hypothetical protein L1049_004744 [Liquidambar formosana]|uniref:Uncharacterized protein n=1 Tax=Liquidambar formosana TaxID=63359 RepID=A0AAP0RPH9_LIQFO